MTVLARPNHPARLAVLFLAAAAMAALVIGAGVALAWVIRDLTQDPRESMVAGLQTAPNANVDVPNGLIVVLPVETPDEFESLAGFAPFVPSKVPATTDPVAKLAVTSPTRTATASVVSPSRRSAMRRSMASAGR
jgi:hypothetical protein